MEMTIEDGEWRRARCEELSARYEAQMDVIGSIARAIAYDGGGVWSADRRGRCGRKATVG